jgi:hypothetical protein
MGQSFGLVVPLEFWQVFEVPYVLGVEISFLWHHFLAVEGKSSQFGHAFICKFHPSLSEAYLFVTALTHSVLVGPVALCEQVDAFNEVAGEQFADVVGLHVGGNAAEIADSSVGLLVLEVF